MGPSKLKYSMIVRVWYCCRGPQWKRSGAMSCVTERLCHPGIIPKYCQSGLVSTSHTCTVQAELLLPIAACMSNTELQLLISHSLAGCLSSILISFNSKERGVQFLFMQADSDQVLQQERLSPPGLFFFVLCSIKAGNLKAG